MIVAAGYSCGGLEAYEQAKDARVSAFGIFSSGQFNAADTKKVIPGVTKPIFYFMGRSKDIAYANGHRDYDAIITVPSWIGDLPVGHEGIFKKPNGGKYATAGVNFFKWILKGDQAGKAYFAGAGTKNDGWTVASKNLAKMP